MKLSSNANISVNDRILIFILLSVQCGALIGQLPFYYFDIAGYSGAHIGDLKAYYEYSLNFVNGGIPYLDFNMEYPPLSLAAFSLPHLFSFIADVGFYEYIGLFVLENMLFSLLASAAIIYISSHLQSARLSVMGSITVYTLGVAICSIILPWRYDMFPALLTIVAFLCIRVDKPLPAGFILGVAVFVKLYPFLLLAVFGIYYLSGNNFRAFRHLTAGAFAALLIVIPFFLLSPGWLNTFLGYHQLRGIQIESLYSGFILMAGAIGLTKVDIVHNYGAVHIISSHADIILRFLPLIIISSIGFVITCCFIRFRQEQADKGHIPFEVLTDYVFMVLLVFILVNKVFSPQYIIWLLPFASFLRSGQARMTLIICLLTALLYPIMYRNLMDLNYIGVTMLNVRNLLVVVLFIWLLKQNLPMISRRRHTPPGA